MKNNGVYAISGTCFNLVLTNEEIEGESLYLFSSANVEVTNKKLMENVNKETIVAFLECDDTEVYIVPEEKGRYDLIAYNSVAKEAVRVSKIGNHFVALIEMVKAANDKRKELRENPKAKILDNDLIKSINEQIMFARYGECGIGEYRTVDFWGRNTDVCLGRIDEEGNRHKIECIEIETSRNNNVPNKMRELIDWANKEIRDGCLMEEIAEFHARFIKIHPFRDGNGRTARLVTNYLLLVSGFPMIDISADKKDEYNLCLNYANSTSEQAFRDEAEEYRDFDDVVAMEQGPRTEDNKYLPLAEFLSGCFMKENSKKLINNIINYRKEGSGKETFKANEILSPSFVK